MIKNLEQVRAHNALKAARTRNLKAEYVKKIPVMISQNGLLGALAFAVDKGKDYTMIFSAVLDHLSADEIRLNKNSASGSVEDFLQALSDASSATLRAVTAEVLAYLNYLRRFVTKEEEGEDAAENRK